MSKSALILAFTVVFCHLSRGQEGLKNYLSQDYFEVRPVVEIESQESNNFGQPYPTSHNEEEVNLAITLWNKGEEKEALAVLDKLKSLTGNKIEIDFLVANLYFQNRSFSKALRLINNILIEEPLMLDAKYLKAVVLMETRNYEEAIVSFEELAKIPATKKLAYYGLGLTQLRKKNLTSSYTLLNQCIQLDSSFMEAYLARARIDVLNNQFEQAQELLKVGMTKYPKWQDGIIFNAAIQFYLDQDTLHFKQEVEYLLQIDPKNIDYLSLLGLIHMELKNWNEAVKLFREAQGINVDHIRESKYRFSTKLKWSESIQDVLDFYFKNYAMEPSSRRLFEQGICFLMTGDVAQTLALFDEALAIEQHAAIFLFKGSILKIISRRSGAIEALSNAINLAPNNWLPYYYRGELYGNLGQDDLAYADYQMAVKFNLKLSDAYKHMGFIEMNKGNYDSAFATFTRAMEIDTVNFDLLFNRAFCGNKINRFQAASSDLSLLTSLKQDREAYYHLHIAQMGIKDTLSALVSLDSASRLSPRLTHYHERLLNLGQACKNSTYQIRALNRLINNDPNNSSLYLLRGKLHLEENILDQAIIDLTKFIKENKKHGEGHHFLGLALVRNGQSKEGNSHLNRANKLGYQPR